MLQKVTGLESFSLAASDSESHPLLFNPDVRSQESCKIVIFCAKFQKEDISCDSIALVDCMTHGERIISCLMSCKFRGKRQES